MKIVLAIDSATNSFRISGDAPAGVTVKSRCENSMFPNKILVEIPDEIITIRESAPAELEQLAALLKEKEELIEDMNALGNELKEQLKDALAAMDALKDEVAAKIAEQKGKAVDTTQTEGQGMSGSNLTQDEFKIPDSNPPAADLTKGQGNG